MRALLYLFLTMNCGLALSTLPTLEQSEVVFTGTVTATRKIKVETEERGGFPFKWELWQAQIRLNQIIKTDRTLDEMVTIYFPQNHKSDGSVYMIVCPQVPQIMVGATNKFYCVASRMEEVSGLLYVPEANWVTDPADVLAEKLEVLLEVQRHKESLKAKRKPDMAVRGARQFKVMRYALLKLPADYAAQTAFDHLVSASVVKAKS